jgi:hypothetical protein
VRKIKQFCSFTRFDLQQFRIRTLLIFHAPVAERARRRLRRQTPRSGVGVSAAYAPGAAREKFSVLDL